MHFRTAFAAVAAMAALLPLHAQSSRDIAPQYKVEFNFRDGADAAAMTDRRFTMLVTEAEKTVFKVGSKTPVASATGSESGTQFTYLDVGVNIECTVRATGDRAMLRGSLDMSNLGPSDGPVVAGVRNPTVRQTKLDLQTTLEFGKPTVVASIDDPLTSRKLQVEATVSKAN
jgi:hypothetical protein